MKTIYGIFSLLSLVVLFLTFGTTIADEVGVKNPNLDDESIALIVDLNYESDILNVDALGESTSPVTDDSSFEGVDPFARQYLEDKSEITQKKSTLDKVLGVPDLILKSIGIQNTALLVTIKLLIVSLLTFVIAIALYKAIRTGETD